MERDRRTTIGSDDQAIPELEQNRPGITDDVQRVGRNVVNTFTVERDTGLADGAGAPGSTDVGGTARDERDRGEE